MPETFMEIKGEWDNYHPLRGRRIDESALLQAKRLLQNADRLPPHAHEYLLKEAITTSDFPYLFGHIIDRTMLGMYAEPINPLFDWHDYVRMAPGGIKDFNTVRREKLHGMDDDLEEIGEKGEYLATKPINCRYEYALKKYGRQFDISFESMVNDQLGAFSTVAQRFANAAKRKEFRIVTGLFSSATGPNTALYGATITDCTQALTNRGTLPLTIANLETTINLMAAQTDPLGTPLGIMPKYLVVPPALQYQARAILTSALKQWTEVGAGGGIPVPTANVMTSQETGLNLKVNKWLPVIDTSGNAGTTWYLFADPAEVAAMEVGYLRGEVGPEIVMKASDKVAIGGGLMDPFSGDFATDNIMYRVRLIMGGGQMDPRATYAQIGTG